MVDVEPLSRTQGQPVIVTFPSEIDMANADSIGGRLAAAFTPGVKVVIADMTATTFCDTLGISMLVWACRMAAAHGGQLRLLLPCPYVLKVMDLLGVDAVLPVYHSLEQALADMGSRQETGELAVRRPCRIKAGRRASAEGKGTVLRCRAGTVGGISAMLTTSPSAVERDDIWLVRVSSGRRRPPGWLSAR
jgi:anti-sigma B factor antagonist